MKTKIILCGIAIASLGLGSLAQAQPRQQREARQDAREAGSDLREAPEDRREVLNQ